MRFRIPLILALVALLSATFVGLHLKAETQIPRSAVVIKTDDMVLFPTVMIQKGGSVVFRNSSKEPFLPASDSHPDHTLYPEFDAGRGLLPGEEWTFTFKQAGAWKYHDHLSHEVRGKILVVGEEGESVEPCLALTASFSVRAECWEIEVAKTLKTEGLESAFKKVRELYVADPKFRDNCHYVMHAFGNAAYGFYAKGEVFEGPETSWCNWGFYHGFIEAMFTEKGDQYGEILEYCEEVGKSKNFLSPSAAQIARLQCIHPLGYGIFDSLNRSLWGNADALVTTGIKTCEKLLSEPKDRVMCSTGIFASLAAAYTNRFYDLSPDGKDPTTLCTKQQFPYDGVCYRYLPVLYAREHRMGPEEAIKYVHSFIGSTAKYWGVAGLVHDEIARPRWNLDFSAWQGICERMESFTEQSACVEAVITGLSSRSEPEREYESMGEFCQAIDQSLRDKCFKKMFEIIRRLYTQEKVIEICSDFLPGHSTGCIWEKEDQWAKRLE